MACRPIIAPQAPVSATMREALSALQTSPLAMTGQGTARTARAMAG